MTMTQIHDFLNECIHQISTQWTDSIPFHVWEWDKHVSDLQSRYSKGIIQLDIANCLLGQDRLLSQKYCPSESSCKTISRKGACLILMKNEYEKAIHQGCNSILSNCGWKKPYKSKASSEMLLQFTTLIVDKRNNCRKEVKPGDKNLKMTLETETFKCNIFIMWYDNGYYTNLRNNQDNQICNGHSKTCNTTISIPTRLLDE